MDVDLERAEIEAFADMYRTVAPGLGIELLELGDVKCGAVRTLDSRIFNRVMGLRDESLFDEIAAFYGETPYVVADTYGVADRLETRGFTPDYGWAKFVRPVEPPPEARTDLRIELIGPERAVDFGRVVTGAYGMPDRLDAWTGAVVGRPGWSCYLALDGDEPAGAGAVYVHEGVGWLGFAGTLPDFRGRGAQGAILAARIRRAAELGCRAVVTETGELQEGRPSNSYRNILRSGFDLVYVRPNLLSPA